MSSSRLPGKALKQIGNHPIIYYILQQLVNLTQLSEVVLLTSEHATDAPLIRYAESLTIPVFCGPLENVALRFYQALEHYQPDYFVRVNGDSPLFHREVLERGLQLLDESPGVDIITNVLPRTFPAGVSFEIISTQCFLEEFPRFSEAEDFEHVTPYFYRNIQAFRIQNICSSEDLSSLKFAVDTIEDLDKVRSVFRLMTKEPLQHSWKEYVQFMKQAVDIL